MSLQKLCLHTITTKPWSLATAAKEYSAAGIGGVSVWRDAAQAHQDGLIDAGKMLRESGLEIVSYVRGGFFTGLEAETRAKSIDDNKKMIDEAAALGAPLIVLVCGATPGQSLFESRKQITESLAVLMPYAESAGIKLGIEPLHPMYADSRSAVVTTSQANNICEQVGSDHLGVTVDVFHVWWDEQLERDIKLLGQKERLFSFHICDWKNQPEDMLNDRGLMGEGVIDIRQIRKWVMDAGFCGFDEVEIFSNRYWAMDQNEYLETIKTAYFENCLKG